MKTEENIINSSKTFVIAIAAVSGGGKTFITTELKQRLSHSKALYFDDYDFDGPEDICEWVEKGSDYNDWDLSPLAKAVESTINHKSEKTEYLLLDYPFAKQHSLMNKYIDYTIFVDTPLDIALSRRIIRDFKDQSPIDIQNELLDYLTHQRVAYLDMLKRIKPNSDFIIDGALDKDMLLNKILEQLYLAKSEFDEK